MHEATPPSGVVTFFDRVMSAWPDSVPAFGNR